MLAISHPSVTTACYRESSLRQRLFVLLRQECYRLFFAMQVSKSNLGLCSSLNFVSLIISAVTLSMLLAGFLRIEMKLNYQDAKLAAVERLCTERAQDMSLADTTKVKGKKNGRAYVCIATSSKMP